MLYGAERSTFLVITSSNATNFQLVQYFNNYPIFSSKHLDYLEWAKILELRIRKEHLTLEGSKIVLTLKILLIEIERNLIGTTYLIFILK